MLGLIALKHIYIDFINKNKYIIKELLNVYTWIWRTKQVQMED